MGISAPFIRRPVATTLLTLGVLLLGLAAWRQLPVAALPTVDLPTLVVRAEMPGASPEIMASAVATPLERRLGIVGGLKELTSINSVGSSTLVAQFDLHRAIDGVAADVQAALNAAAGELPADLPQPPVYIKANPNVFPILTLALTSDVLPPGRVYDLADTVLAQKLSRLPGVGRVALNGAAKSALRVQVKPGALAGLGLTLEALRQAIAGASAHGPKGSLDGYGRSFAIVADDQLLGAEAFRRQIIAWREGAPVRLGDVATVTESVADTRLGSWWNGRRAVLVEVHKQPNANTVATVDRVRGALRQVRAWLPPSVQVHITGDQTDLVRSAIHDLQWTLLLTTALVVMVIGLFLRRMRSALIPALAVPVVLAGTLALMAAWGFSLDNLSVMALIIAVGFIVDDTIVMVENTARLVEEGLPPLTAALRGARQMAFTVVALTVSLLAALIPVLFMPGVLGRFFGEFGVTLAAALAVSALVSLTLTPSLCARLLPGGGARSRRTLEGPVAAATQLYLRSLAWALRRPRRMLAGVFLTMGATVALFGLLPKGLMPAQDTGLLRAVTDAAPGISFAAMSERQRAVSAVLLADPAVAGVTSVVGVGLWNALNNGLITLNLKPPAERAPAAEVLERLRPQLARIPGIDTYLSLVDDFGVGGRAGRARYQYTLQGADLAELGYWAGRLREAMSRLPGLTDLSTDQDDNGLQAHLALDRASAARLGVSPEAIDQTLFDAYGQRPIATQYGALDQFRVVLEVDPAQRQDPAALGGLFVAGAKGQPVPLSAVTRVERRLTPAQVNHQGQLPAVTIGFNTRPGVSIGEAIARIDAAAKALHLPEGMSARFAGQAQAADDSINAQVWLLLGALVAVYIVLGVLYESYAHPLTILSTVPSAGLGAALALLITGTELSFIALIGLILLIGIVLKNAIMMVDFALVAERELGLPPQAAILRAARLRLRPITMTTLAAVLGALPLALGLGVGAELRQPLGIAIVGGLLVAQFVTIYTTPVVYLAVDRLRGRRRSRWLPAELPAG